VDLRSDYGVQPVAERDVVVVGYDNTDICIGLTPILTTVDYRAEEVGKCLAGELLALIEGRVNSIQRAIQPFLVERESHGPISRPRV
jgi:LacI family transcriptional regulator